MNPISKQIREYNNLKKDGFQKDTPLAEFTNVNDNVTTRYIRIMEERRHPDGTYMRGYRTEILRENEA